MNAAICGGENLQDNIGKGPLIVFGVIYPQFHRRRVSWESILIYKLDAGRIPDHNNAAICEGCQFGAGRARQSARERLSN